ncbi:MFS transporter [Nocardioides sp. NPDC127503]|uniref:MFS transporter n=1 Tax=Nocardioides sp. NPDC127503 TaxID=3154516 RepID=UPI00332E3B80
MTVSETARGTAAPGRDFDRLWLATATSQAGSTIAYGALPLVAVLVLDSSTFQVSLLAALSGFAAAAAGIRLGPWIEYRYKRPTMIGADLIRFAAMLSIPAAGVFDMLTYAHLCVVGVLAATCELAFTAASGAHLKALVSPEARLAATSRLETTFWTTFTAGPPVGGALVSAFGPTLTVLVDAMTYLLSALGIRSIRTPEPQPPTRKPQHWLAEVTAGWSYILARRDLRALFLNAALFGSCVIATSPLQTVLTLRVLGMEPWMYGVAMGLPCLGGILGAMCAPRLTNRLGERAVLLGSGVARTPLDHPDRLHPERAGRLRVVHRRQLRADPLRRGLQPDVRHLQDARDRRRSHGPGAGGMVDHDEGRPARRRPGGRRTGRGDEPSDRDRGGRRRTSALLWTASLAERCDEEPYL